MRWSLRAWAWCLAVVVVAGVVVPTAWAEGPAIAVERVDAAEFPTVRAYVSVATAGGVPITGLDAQAFQVHEDGKPVEGLQVEPIVDSHEPIAAALVIDTSGSMADDSKLARAKDAASAFVDQLGPADQATVVGFSERVSVLQDYSSDKAALKAAIGNLNAKGDTALYDAIAQTGRRQAGQPERRKALVVLTDGADTHSTASLDASIAAAGGPVYAIGLGSDVKHEVLDQIASATGGQAVYLSDAAELKATLLSIADQLRRQYVLRYTSQLAADTKPHGLAIQASYSGYQVTGLGSFSPPARVLPTPTLPPTPAQPPVPTAAPAPTSAPVATASFSGAVASPVSSLAMSDLVLAAGLLLVLLGLGLGIVYLLRRRPHLPAAEPPPVEPDEPSDLTEDIAGATMLGDATIVRPNGRGRTLRARLLIARRGEQREVALDQAEATLGRDESIAVPLGDPQASRKHARIFRQDGHFWIEDLNSLNGTQVNGESVTRRQLATRDRIGIGETVLTFMVDPA